jgi:hypothetical protein
MHLVGFVISIYHDARSPERQISFTASLCTLWTDHLVNVFLTCCGLYLRHIHGVIDCDIRMTKH